MRTAYFLATVAGLALLAGLTSADRANAKQVAPQDPSPSVVDDVVVTAQRREQKLQDIPLSVTALSGETLIQQGVRSLGDLSAGRVPGLQVTTFAGSPSILSLNVRGISSSDPGQGTQELPVPVYVDGVYLGRAQGLGFQLAEPERVEILRGPQSTLFGRNAEGGAVQYVTRKPSGVFGVNLGATYGNYNLQRFSGRVDLPAFANVAAQLSYTQVSHDGYTTNGPKVAGLNAQRDFGEQDDSGYRAALRWTPTDSLTIDYAYDHADLDYTSAYSTNGGLVGTGPILPQHGFIKRSEEPLYNNGWQEQIDGHALTIAWELSDSATLKYIGSYRKVSNEGAQPLGSTQNSLGILPFSRVESTQKSHEIQLIGDLSRLQYVVGAISYNEDVSDYRQNFRTLNAGVPVNPDPAFAVLGLPSQQYATVDSYAFYGQGTWTPPVLGDRLELTFGARYSNDEKEARRTQGNPPFVYPLTREVSGDRVDPTASAKFNWTDTFQTYIRYAVGYRGGGTSVRSSQFRTYDEEELKAWEVGFKSQIWDNRARLNVAAYQNTIVGAQLSLQEAGTPSPSVTETINSPLDFKTRGVEVEFTAQVTDSLSVGVNYAYGDYDFPSFFYAASGVVETFVPNGQSEHSGSFFVEYETRSLPVGQIVWHVDYVGASDYEVTSRITPFQTPSAHFSPAQVDDWNARVTWKDIPVGGGFMEAAVWVKNLTDADNYRFNSPVLGTLRTNVVYEDPLTAGFDLRFKY